MTPPRKPAAKKPAAARKKPQAARSGTDRRAQAKKDVAKTGKVAEGSAPSGRRLGAAGQALRDQLMIQRLAEGWTWETIAEEAGISVPAAKKAVKARQESAPFRLDADPVEVVQRIFEGYQLSIGGFEALAVEAAGKNQLAVAVGAKKGANEARDKLLGLLQATGRLPQEMGALRHLIDLRAIATRMLDAMDEFDRDMLLIGQIPDDDERKAAARDAAAKVRLTFGQMLGIDEPPEADVVEDLPALEA